MSKDLEQKELVVEEVELSAEEMAAQAQAVLAEFDKESNTRHFTGLPKSLIRYGLAAFSIFALWMNTISTMPEQQRRATFVGIVVFMAFILYPLNKKAVLRVNHVPWYDMILAVVGSGCFFYYTLNYKQLIRRTGANSQLDVIVGIIGIVILYEVCRRVVGMPILVVVTCFILYAFYSGFTVQRIIAHLFYTTEGVIGTPLGVCATFIVLFILFGSFLDKTGVGKFFIDVANSMAGGATGGPAKVAVIASALQGMISGSSVANTVGSGSFTIPMMKKTGYKPEFAGAVEAAASTGGQIMPPIMGAAAFLMAEMTGIPYSTIVIAAILPAFLYFAGIFITIHFEAKKLGLKGMPKDEIPKFFPLMKEKGFLILPLIVLVYMMMTGYTPSRSAIIAIITAIIVSMFRKETRMTPVTFVDALEGGAKSTLGVAVACAIAGMIVGIVTLTGIGLKLASGLIAMSGGIPIIALFFTMIACIILGMGVPTTANYVIMATITAPIVVKLGIPVLAAHMFVFYFGIVADITPPVALAAYAGSAIAKSDPMKTAINATKLAIAAFIIPYIFAFSPEMLIVSADPNAVIDVFGAITITITSFIGMCAVAGGLEGFVLTHMKAWERLLSLGAGLLLIKPGMVTDVIGLGTILALLLIQKSTLNKQKLKIS